MGIASLILGICSIVFSWFSGVGVFFSIPGIILGALGKKSPEKAGLANAGLILSIIGAVLSVIVFVACVACIGAAADYGYYY